MYEELAACDSSPTCQGETGCPQTLIFRVTTTLTPVFPQYKWRTVVTFTASKDPECTGDCVTGATATYDSDLFDVGDCNNFPFELDKVSEDTTDACGGALPATITLDE